MERTSLTEIITVYERMQRRRASTAVFRLSKFGLPTTTDVDDVEETISLVPSFNADLQQPELDPTQVPPSNEYINTNFVPDSDEDIENPPGTQPQNGPFGSISSLGPVHEPGLYQKNPRHQKYQQKKAADVVATRNVLNFNKFRNIHPRKYTFFSKATKLLQSDHLDGLSPNSDYARLLKCPHYWLHITNPSEFDLTVLFRSFNVHDLTISDIRESRTQEKIEIFNHYTFISMRLMADSEQPENGRQQQLRKVDKMDMDFNILLFKDFVITLHARVWPSTKNMLGFLNLLTAHTAIPLTPDWVLFSVFIELGHDAQHVVDKMGLEIQLIRVGSKSSALTEMSDVLRRNFNMEFQIYRISRLLKPKMNILRTLQARCGKRLNELVFRLLADVREDFKGISDELEVLDRILERSQDTFLALVSVERSREANDMSKVMKRISEIALVCVPVQAIAGFMGMNMTVPFQDQDSTFAFWVIVGGSMGITALVYFCRSWLLRKSCARWWRRSGVEDEDYYDGFEDYHGYHKE